MKGETKAGDESGRRNQELARRKQETKAGDESGIEMKAGDESRRQKRQETKAGDESGRRKRETKANGHVHLAETEATAA